MALTKKILSETVQSLLEVFGAKFDERFERIDERFERIDKRFERIDKRFDRIDERFERIDERFERIETLLVSHDNTLKTLVTREEFNVFKMENLNAHANLATSIEKLDQEFTVFTAAHDRLEQRVDELALSAR